MLLEDMLEDMQKDVQEDMLEDVLEDVQEDMLEEWPVADKPLLLNQLQLSWVSFDRSIK